MWLLQWVLRTFNDLDIVSVALLLGPALLVMMLRLLDMTLVVFRTTFVVTGRTVPAALTAAVEGLVWLAAAGIVLARPDPLRAAGYALGVGLGTALGMQTIRRLRLGLVTIRTFGPPPSGDEAAAILRGLGHGATVFDGRGGQGPTQMVLSIMRRKEARAAVKAIETVESLLVTVDSNPGPGQSIAGTHGRSL